MTSVHCSLQLTGNTYSVYESIMFATLEKDKSLFLKSKHEAVDFALLHDNKFSSILPYKMQYDF